MSKTDLSVRVDEVRLFMLFALFGGKIERTAAVGGVPVEIVQALAHDFNWKDKVNGKSDLTTDEGKEYEKAMNRVASYVTAVRMANVMGRLVDELDKDPSFARAFCTEVDDETGERSFNTKNLVELAKGMQIVDDLKYRALGDKVAQAADTTGQKTQSQIVLNVYQSLASRFDRSQVVDTPVEVVRAVDGAQPAIPV